MVHFLQKIITKSETGERGVGGGGAVFYSEAAARAFVRILYLQQSSDRKFPFENVSDIVTGITFFSSFS